MGTGGGQATLRAACTYQQNDRCTPSSRVITHGGQATLRAAWGLKLRELRLNPGNAHVFGLSLLYGVAGDGDGDGGDDAGGD